MEKTESLYENLICTACLCVDRKLQNISNETCKQFYLKILHELPVNNSVNLEPRICWECDAVLKKLISFKEQVKDSYRILQTYTNENLLEHLLSDVSRLPRLSIKNATYVSIDSDGSCNVLGASEIKFARMYTDEKLCPNIKEESPHSDTENPYLTDYSEDLVNLKNEVETYKQERKKKRKRREKSKKIQKIVKKNELTKLPETQPKVQTIELSYEEMLSERSRDAIKDSYVNAEFKCEGCLIGFNYDKSYDEHMANKHCPDLGNYSCPICKTVIASVESFTAHYKRHMRRYECSVCGKRTMDRKFLLQHYDTLHDGNTREYKCNICGKLSFTIDAHRYHISTHKQRAECKDCDKTFSHRSGLMNHRLTAHKLNNGFPCNKCEKKFRWKTSLKKHMEKHDKKDVLSSDQIICEPCGVTFASVCSLQRHMRNSLKHVTENELKYICDHCNRKFANKTKLRDHIEEKHLHKTYQCYICLKPSKNRVCLDQHIRNVHKGRPKNKICHHCGKGFPTNIQLDSHIRSHTGEKPYICEYCPTTFSLQSNLYKHNRQVHMNIKAKRYPLCRKRKEKIDTPISYQPIYHKDVPPPLVYPHVPPPLVYPHDKEYVLGL